MPNKLKKLVLKKFQKHHSKVIKFSPQITVIVGETGKGKSSLLRGLQWVCTNKPLGASYIRHGEEEAVGILYFGTHRLVRKRGKKKNYYKLDEEKPFHCLKKTGVPEKVADLLNIAPVSWQNQLDPHFWFSETAGQVSKNLNAVVNLDVIDDSLAAAAAGLRDAKATERVCAERLASAKIKKGELKWVLRFRKRLSTLESLESLISKEIDSISSLASLTEGLEETSATFDWCLKNERLAGETYTTAAGLAKEEGVVIELASLVTKIEEARRLATIILPDFDPLPSLWNDYNRLLNEIHILTRMIEELGTWQKRQTESATALQKTQVLLEKESGGVCPICRGPMTL